MLDFDAAVATVLFVLWVFSIIDCITTPTPRHLPKQMWLLLLLGTPEIGWVLWFVAGRERAVPEGAEERLAAGPVANLQAEALTSLRSMSLVKHRPAPLAPDDDPVFLASLDEKIAPKPDEDDPQT